MKRLFAAAFLCGSIFAAVPANAGYWGYAQCVAEKRAWQGMRGMAALSLTTPFILGTAASCFEAF